MEAKISWLSSIAIAKGDMPKTAPVVEAEKVAVVERRQENAWSKLPQGTIVGEARIYPNTRPSASIALTEIMRQQEERNRPAPRGMAYAPDYRFINAKFPSTCSGCENDIERGDIILWYKHRKTVYCGNCDEFRAANVERMANGLTDVRTWRN